MKRSPKPPRNRELARIHILAGALDLERDVYEAVLWTQGRQDSAGKLDEGGRRKVLAHLEQLLRELKPNHPALSGATPGQPRNYDKREELRKIEALLADADKPWAYAVAIVRNQYGKDRLEFCEPYQLGAVIAALHRPAVKRLQAQLQATFGDAWSNQVAYYAAWLFDFPTVKRDVTRYPEPMSQVLRWHRGELQAACTWPVDPEHPKCCAGCHKRTGQG